MHTVAVLALEKFREKNTIRFLFHRAAVLVVLAFSFSPLPALADARLFQVVAFGDSLLDAGTYSQFASYFGGGRFTTNPGLNFTQDIAQHYGGSLSPAYEGGFGYPLTRTQFSDGFDYAQGGSRVKMQPGIGHAPPGYPDDALATTIPVKEQVERYLSQYRRFTDDQLVLINGGANDIFFQLATTQDQTAIVQAIGEAATALGDIVTTLVANGAKHVAVMNVPDIGMTPLGVLSQDHGQLLTELSQLFNNTLAAALEVRLYNSPGKVVLIDSFRFIRRVIANHEKFNFSHSNNEFACQFVAQVTEAALLCNNNPPISSSPLLCPVIQANESLYQSSLFCSPNTYATGADYSFMFADLIHPTTHLGNLVAEFVERHISFGDRVASE